MYTIKAVLMFLLNSILVVIKFILALFFSLLGKIFPKGLPELLIIAGIIGGCFIILCVIFGVRDSNRRKRLIAESARERTAHPGHKGLTKADLYLLRLDKKWFSFLNDIADIYYEYYENSFYSGLLTLVTGDRGEADKWVRRTANKPVCAYLKNKYGFEKYSDFHYLIDTIDKINEMDNIYCIKKKGEYAIEWRLKQN